MSNENPTVSQDPTNTGERFHQDPGALGAGAGAAAGVNRGYSSSIRLPSGRKIPRYSKEKTFRLNDTVTRIPEGAEKIICHEPLTRFPRIPASVKEVLCEDIPLEEPYKRLYEEYKQSKYGWHPLGVRLLRSAAMNRFREEVNRLAQGGKRKTHRRRKAKQTRRRR